MAAQETETSPGPAGAYMHMLKSLVPDEFIRALVRTAQVEILITSGDEVPYPDFDVEALERELAEDRHEEDDAGTTAELQQQFVSFVRQVAGKTGREIAEAAPDVQSALLEDEVREVKSILASSWLEIVWSCARNSRPEYALLGADLLPIQRNDHLVRRAHANWHEALEANVGQCIPHEAVRWLYRIFEERLRQQVDAACDAEEFGKGEFTIMEKDHERVVIRRTPLNLPEHQRAPYEMVVIGRR